MSKQAHKRRVARLRKKGHDELADEVEKVAQEQGYENDYLAVQLETAGKGHHFSLMTAGGYLKSYWGWGAKRVTKYLESQYDPNRDPNAPSAAVSKLFNQSFDEVGGRKKTVAKYPEPFSGLAEAVETYSYKQLKSGSKDLAKKSPIEILRSLFPEGDPFINLGGIRQSAGVTTPLSKWNNKRVTRSPFIVPNPMKNSKGMTTAGNPSPKCNDNILRREHIVVEFDSVSCKDRQLGILSYLNDYAPLKMVLFSGGKSIHGWFYCGCDEGQASWQQFFIIACFFGADRAMATESQYCRMPNVIRDNGKKQRLLYLDAELNDANSWDIEGLIRNVKTLIN